MTTASWLVPAINAAILATWNLTKRPRARVYQWLLAHWHEGMRASGRTYGRVWRRMTKQGGKTRR